MELKHTPPLLAEQGFISIQDLMTGLNLSRTGVYELLKKINPDPDVYRVGKSSYFRLSDILDYIKTSGEPIRKRAPRGSRGS